MPSDESPAGNFVGEDRQEILDAVKAAWEQVVSDHVSRMVLLEGNAG
jgi:hypothetical protein